MAALQEAIETAKREGGTPFFVGATAGTTVTGAFDPLEPLAQVSSHPLTTCVPEHATLQDATSPSGAHSSRGNIPLQETSNILDGTVGSSEMSLLVPASR